MSRLAKIDRALGGKMPELRARFGARALVSFGSCVRNEQTASSNVDLVVSCERRWVI